MNRHVSITTLLALGCLSLLTPTFAAPNPPGPAYPNGPKTAQKIGNDLYGTLNAKYQKNLNPELIQIENTDAPVITPVEGCDNNKTLFSVSVSVGYIDLINHIAHARAVDHLQPGFFQQYVQNLARQTGKVVPADMVDPRFWSEDVMNDQMSFFNQMMGMTVAINLSHHYLGHYHKYASQMLAGKLTPVNNFLAPAEWDASVKAATLNSLDCALGTEGAKALFDAIDAMPARPAWASFIVPPAIDIKKLDRTLAGYETDYFRGGLTLPATLAPLAAVPGQP